MYLCYTLIFVNFDGLLLMNRYVLFTNSNSPKLQMHSFNFLSPKGESEPRLF